MIDLGNGHRLVFTSSEYEATGEPLTLAQACGGIHEHPNAKDGPPCAGYVHFRGRPDRRSGENRPAWEIVQDEPLTLSPSLLCRTCGSHGFIRNGKWVPA